jgi:quercetin dioxygenase-like cupin family protein
MRMALLSGAVLAAVATIAASQAAEPVKSQSSEVVTAPLTGDASREVRVFNVLLPPSADSGRHYHHGDQCTTVQEGEIHIDIDGKGDRAYKAGEAVHIDPMVVHRTQNLSGAPARTVELFIVAKGKPIAEKSE